MEFGWSESLWDFRGREKTKKISRSVAAVVSIPRPCHVGTPGIRRAASLSMTNGVEYESGCLVVRAVVAPPWGENKKLAPHGQPEISD